MKAFRFRAELDADPPEIVELWALGCRGLQQEGDEVLAWFDDERPLPLPGRWQEEEGTDWVAAYLAELHPVRLGTLIVAPTHRRVTLEAGQRVLWLDPGMAFGTGHHETTRMALEGLERSDPRGASVLDVGAGSGILAIAADLLGASKVLGVDVDAATLEVARHNAALNRSRAYFRQGSTDVAGEGGMAGWDVIVANLFAELHVRLLDAYAALLRPGGRLLATGILDEREALLDDAIAAAPEGTWRSERGHATGPWRLRELVRR